VRALSFDFGEADHADILSLEIVPLLRRLLLQYELPDEVSATAWSFFQFLLLRSIRATEYHAENQSQRGGFHHRGAVSELTRQLCALLMDLFNSAYRASSRAPTAEQAHKDFSSNDIVSVLPAKSISDRVALVKPTRLAAELGMLKGDVIVAVNGRKVATKDGLFLLANDVGPFSVRISRRPRDSLTAVIHVWSLIRHCASTVAGASQMALLNVPVRLLNITQGVSDARGVLKVLAARMLAHVPPALHQEDFIQTTLTQLGHSTTVFNTACSEGDRQSMANQHVLLLHNLATQKEWAGKVAEGVLQALAKTPALLDSLEAAAQDERGVGADAHEKCMALVEQCSSTVGALCLLGGHFESACTGALAKCTGANGQASERCTVVSSGKDVHIYRNSKPDGPPSYPAICLRELCGSVTYTSEKGLVALKCQRSFGTVVLDQHATGGVSEGRFYYEVKVVREGAVTFDTHNMRLLIGDFTSNVSRCRTNWLVRRILLASVVQGCW
jgi:hypothetical protein